MAGSSSSRKSLRSYQVKSSNLTIAVGDDVLVKPSTGTKPWIAKVDEILSDKKGRNVTVVGRWFYRPEDTRGGRKDFHGSSELLLSNHCDNLMPQSIAGKCTVHTLKNYRQLETIGPDNYYYRLMYDPFNESFNPKNLPMYCSCEKPYNPDLKMVLCENCRIWFHIRCIGMTDVEIEATAHFICADCGGGEASSRNPAATSTGESRQGRTPARRRRRTAMAEPRA